MPLTPQDVATKEFTVTRIGRGGYDEGEVDDFLDEVEAELTRLYRENDDLRRKLTLAQQELESARRRVAEDGGEEERKAVTASVAPAQSAPPAPAPATASPAEAAAGILAMAQRTADEYVAEAKSQAERILGEARGQAERVSHEAEERRRQTLGGLEHERSALERAIEELRAFEGEYRSRLKSYLESQLRELDGSPDVAGASRNGASSAANDGRAGAPADGQGNTDG